MMKKLFIITILLSLIKITNAQQGGELKADFDYSPKFIITSDLTITFTDKSTGSMTYWYWDFGDGTIVTTQNPSHKYTKSGIYQVSLTVGDDNGNINTKIIAVDARIFIPDFTYSSPSGKFISNEEIQFSDQTPNTPETWLWDFGDGTTSSAQNPKHIYTKIGTYSVKLTVTKLNTTKTIDKPVTINISKLKFSGKIVDATTKMTLKNMTIVLFRCVDEYNKYACDGVWRSGYEKLLTLQTDANGNFFSTMSWDGKDNLVVYIYDAINNIYIPYLGKFTGYREELSISCFLNGNDKICLVPVRVGSNTWQFTYNIEWSYSINNIGKLPIKWCGEGHVGGYFGIQREGDYSFYSSSLDYNPDGNNIHGVTTYTFGCPYYDVDYFYNVYMWYDFDVGDYGLSFNLKSKLYILKVRKSNNIVPDFEFENNSDFIAVGDITKIKDTSTPFIKISKIEINWGDGTINTYQMGTTYPTSRLFEHTYSAEGEYTVLLKTFDASGWNASTSSKCKVISCSSGPFEYIYAYSKLVIASDNINKVNFNYDDMLSLKYPGQYKPFSECIMEACNQIKIGPNSILSQTLNVPLTLRIITPGSVIKSTKADNNNSSGIQEETNMPTTESEGVFIYPNPASQFFTIKTTGKSLLKSYELFNNVGNCVKNENCTGSESRVDISSLPSGVYVVKVVTEDKLFNTKLIIE